MKLNDNTKNKMMRKLLLLLIVSVSGILTTIAQDKNDYSNSAISITEADVKGYFEKNMELKPTETEKFWKIYGQYVNELKPITDKNNQLLKDVIENKSMSTEEQIDQKILTSLNMQEKAIEIRIKYYNKIKAELNKNIASQFYQIDHYLSCYLAASLNEELPYYNAK